MKPFPTDAEIIAAIQLLAQANVLREYELMTYTSREMERRLPPEAILEIRDDAVERAKRQMAYKLVDTLVGSEGWQASHLRGFDQGCRLHGFVIAYSDARRALTP